MMDFRLPPFLTRLTLQQWIVLVFVIVCGTVNTVAYDLYRRNAEQDEIRRSVEMTYNVVRAAGDVQFTAQDMTVALRGYLLTGDKSLIPIYEAARKSLQPAVQKMMGLLDDNLSRTRQVRELQGVLTAQDTLLQRQFDRYGQGLGVSLADMNRSRELLDHVHATTTALLTSEQSRLLARFGTDTVRQGDHIRTLLVSAWLSLLALLFVTFLRPRRLELPGHPFFGKPSSARSLSEKR